MHVPEWVATYGVYLHRTLQELQSAPRIFDHFLCFICKLTKKWVTCKFLYTDVMQQNLVTYIIFISPWTLIRFSSSALCTSFCCFCCLLLLFSFFTIIFTRCGRVCNRITLLSTECCCKWCFLFVCCVVHCNPLAHIYLWKCESRYDGGRSKHDR